MQALLLTCPSDDAERVIAELWELGTSGVIEGDELGGAIELQAFFDQSFAADLFADYNPRWGEAEERNWVREIMEGWDPLEVGERFFVVPDWCDDPTPPGRLRLEVHPGIALGTGYHATTQMCLEAMERRLLRSDCFFDLGAGSGILSHAAQLLGAGRIVACDIDPQASASAAENLRRANVPALVYTGSTRSIAGGSVDLLVANISASTLALLAAELRRILKPDGLAILSGFEPSRSAEVARDWDLLNSESRGEWAAVVVRHSGDNRKLGGG